MKSALKQKFVVPAKAGAGGGGNQKSRQSRFLTPVVDPRLRGDDKEGKK
jgi:hypothetical protein